MDDTILSKPGVEKQRSAAEGKANPWQSENRVALLPITYTSCEAAIQQTAPRYVSAYNTILKTIVYRRYFYFITKLLVVMRVIYDCMTAFTSRSMLSLTAGNWSARLSFSSRSVRKRYSALVFCPSNCSR